MYIIERLLKDYPQHKEDIENFGKFLETTVKDVRRIADDSKFNYKWIDAAYRAGPDSDDKSEYIRNMALYEFSFNYDIDFLKMFVTDGSAEGKTVDELRKQLLKETYSEEREIMNKKKLELI